MRPERRLSARIAAPYPVRLWSVDYIGQKFKEDTLVGNLSGGGLYLRLMRKLVEGTRVSLAVRLSITPPVTPALRLAGRGTVVRVEPQPDGQYGIAIQFIKRRVL